MLENAFDTLIRLNSETMIPDDLPMYYYAKSDPVIDPRNGENDAGYTVEYSVNWEQLPFVWLNDFGTLHIESVCIYDGSYDSEAALCSIS